MKRSMDVARQILMAATEQPYDVPMISVEGVDHNTFVMHTQWLIDAGLVVGEARVGSGAFVNGARTDRLTWAGCDFVEASSDPGLWARAKEVVIKPAGGVAFAVLLEWLRAEALRRLGLQAESIAERS